MELTIDRLGTDGAGLARDEDRIVVIPGGLPGERVRVDWQGGKTPATLVDVLTPSADRVTPVCQHYGQCGGCTQQHFSETLQAEAKRARIRNALARVGLGAVEVLPVLTSPPGSRRRAGFEAVKRRGEITLGFHAAGSHSITAIHECPVLLPEIVTFLPALTALLNRLLNNGDAATIQVSACDTGLDVGLTVARPTDLEILELLGAFATEQDLARLWWRSGKEPPMPIAARRKPLVRLGEAFVELPPGGFQQATADGERALIDACLSAVGPAKNVADLFAGIGTFSLPFGKNCHIHAVEANAIALSALDSAARKAGFHRVTTERRDLESRPLLPVELNRFDAVIFDPPRAGAAAQVAELACSTVPVIVGISCDPATFARDAATLVAGGYRLETLQPVDQFRWSSHLELAATFRR